LAEIQRLENESVQAELQSKLERQNVFAIYQPKSWSSAPRRLPLWKIKMPAKLQETSGQGTSTKLTGITRLRIQAKLNQAEKNTDLLLSAGP
jgi:hypothetical protein